MNRDDMVRAFQVAFTEWDRRYRENPDDFWSVVQHLLGNTSASYGEACGIYFAELLDDAAKGRPWGEITPA